jgi:hypothetical protein
MPHGAAEVTPWQIWQLIRYRTALITTPNPVRSSHRNVMVAHCIRTKSKAVQDGEGSGPCRQRHVTGWLGYRAAMRRPRSASSSREEGSPSFFTFTRDEFTEEFVHPDDRPAVAEARQRRALQVRAEYLTEMRKKAGMTQAEVAEAMG